MRYKIIVCSIIGLLPSLYAGAQVKLIPLQGNPTIENYNKSNLNAKSLVRSIDTLALPFFDDFAKTDIFPDTSNWLDNDVFINPSFGDNPPSIGVATFDALDYEGKLQSNASILGFVSDYLTSKPINLFDYTDKNPISISTDTLFYYETATHSYHSADSLYYVINPNVYNCAANPTTYNIDMTIYYGSNYIDVSDSLYTYNPVSGLFEHIDDILYFTYSPADSLYMSFYFQPQGLAGNDPENTDSLVLEFKDKNGGWNHIWAKSGTTNKAFKQVLIPITDSLYFSEAFQFRFKNYASIGVSFPSVEASFAGNADIWNIDYVSLSRKRHQFDTIPDDVTFVHNAYSFLEDYTSVPWSHYKSTNGFQIDTLKFLYRNLSDTTKNVQRGYRVTNKTTNTIIFNRSLGNENIGPLGDSLFVRKDTSKYFIQTTGEEATFEVLIHQTSSILPVHEPYRWNDTIKFYQKFSNYYAYDDGIPESGFGIAGEGTGNAMLAYKFYTLKPDTLRGVYMFFNRTLNNANQKYFYITVWSSYNGKPNSIIYKQEESIRPVFDGFNEFHYYTLDTALFIADTFFIGWTQTDEVLLDVGFDFNYDASNKVFFQISSFYPWTNLPYPGTPMIRPVFSTQPFVGIDESLHASEIKIYPNPASDIITIEAPENFKFQLYNITGKCILETKNNNHIFNVSDLHPGIYIVRGTDGNSYITHKIIINR